MRFTRAGRASLAAAGTVAVALAAAACSGSSPGMTSAMTSAHLEKTSLTVGSLPVVDTAGLYLAQKEGYFKDAGLNVTIQPIPADPQAIQEMVHGQVDIVGGANYVSFLQADAGGHAGQFKILVDGQSCSANTFEILALPGSHITSPDSLVGKTIAVNVPDNIQTLLTNTALQTSGIPASDVHYRVIPFPKMAAALNAHQVDAISVVEPFITAAELAYGAQPVMSTCTGPTGNFPMSGYFSTQAWARKYPNTARAFQAALDRGQALADANRAAVEQVLPSYIKGLTPEEAAVVNLGQFPTSLDYTHVQRVAKLMINGGLLNPNFTVQPLLFH
jgi:NitT/TauT family transport system substrate-binding protein